MHLKRGTFRRQPWWRSFLHFVGCVALLFGCASVPVQRAAAAGVVPPGTWRMGEKVAILIFECGGMLCGRVAWLKEPFNAQGLLKRDGLNPDRALRQRQVCGPTIIWNLRSTDPNRWEGGWLYNPDDGITYRAGIELKSPDEIIARIYLAYPVFGVTRTLIRVSQGTAAGWC